MERKLVLTSIIVILFTSLFCLSFRVEKVQASGTIYIRADGSIDPPTANITTIDNVTYTFTGNITDGIVIERSDTIIDGAEYTLQGSGDGVGLNLTNVHNNTLRNMNIKNFEYGIRLEASSKINIHGNNITNNWDAGVFLYSSSHYNTVSGNNITNNRYGVLLSSTSNNSVSGNNITNNTWGIWISFSSNNTVSGNNITNNGCGIWVQASDYNEFYHNYFLGNINQTYVFSGVSIWDNGCEGNFWSDYNGSDLSGDGIGDTPYIIDGNNQDYYPLMNLYWNPADINHDLEVDIFDVVLACVAYSSTPSDLNWNCHGDIAEPYGVIDIFDIVMICSSYGEAYAP